MPETEANTTVGKELEQFFGRQKTGQDDLSTAFQEASSQPPTFRDVHTIQLQTREELEHLYGVVRSLKRLLILSTFTMMAVVVFFAAVIAFLYVRQPHTPLSGEPAVKMSEFQKRTVPEGAQGESFAELPLVTSGKPQTDDDRAIFPFLLDLYRRARSLRGLARDRTRSEEYVLFLTDATKLAEQTAEGDISPDLSRAIVRITELAKQTYYESSSPTLESQTLDAEIRAVLRDYAPRESLLRDRPSM